MRRRRSGEAIFRKVSYRVLMVFGVSPIERTERAAMTVRSVPGSRNGMRRTNRAPQGMPEAEKSALNRRYQQLHQERRG
jgi:hypothetical protein